MSIEKKLDWWSIMDGLDKLIDFDLNGNEKSSIYWDYYEEQIRELAVLAADMYNEMDQIKTALWHLELPEKQIEFCEEDECTQTIIAWWNSAACMLSDIDMATLLENENRYGMDEDNEKEKRIRALERLTKKQYFKLQSLGNFFYKNSPMIAETDSEVAADSLMETLHNINLENLCIRTNEVDENGHWFARFEVEPE